MISLCAVEQMVYDAKKSFPLGVFMTSRVNNSELPIISDLSKDYIVNHKCKIYSFNDARWDETCYVLRYEGVE